jgi:hypothetical protein
LKLEERQLAVDGNIIILSSSNDWTSFAFGTLDLINSTASSACLIALKSKGFLVHDPIQSWV